MKGDSLLQIGAEYLERNSEEIIILNRLVQLQQNFGSEDLKRAVLEGLSSNTWMRLHITNLTQTYTTAKVVKVYEQFYSKVG